MAATKDIKKIQFGIEIEFTGISKQMTLDAIRSVVGGVPSNSSSMSNILTSDGRKWTVVYDSSISSRITTDGVISAITNYMRVNRITSLASTADMNRHLTRANDTFNGTHTNQVEFITPICKFEDIEVIQKIIRAIKKLGGITNESCGIHMHVGLQSMNYRTARNAIQMFGHAESEIFKIFKPHSHRTRYCAKMPNSLIDICESTRGNTSDQIRAKFRGTSSSNTAIGKYRALNVSNIFGSISSKSTIEFRLFNSTLHAGKVKSYIIFVLAIILNANKSQEVISTNRLKLSTERDILNLLMDTSLDLAYLVPVVEHLVNGMKNERYYK